MDAILITIIIVLFVAMLFVNIYFRVKVFKAYKYLVQNNIEFSIQHIFNEKKMNADVFPRYPNHIDQIRTFCNNLRYSIKMATVLIVLITLFGGVLMYYR